ncbi:hypothetical protein [Streptococcus ruminantium]|uniref:Uncharacterized protein n=2 Tax=Streptococcus ruminantium TaxID=1917441 RepID=A0ABU1B5N2_9STRE|nr:hypothetical protein [Streptococcus ruminantium]MDQ8758810.1 hypothetical protein [Streptococcus ruminantium]MDQ8768272.1 hypothetical protein [Streptococcus ruminantium]MDQ8774648.1 hypothetical protein [Streptococcus ruminantium]MDQ8794646.1 hypothetical protein [Streptococcus ruminantium]MDQ8795525.1 hypothetical protein [Streptococcus ruminantium]
MALRGMVGDSGYRYFLADTNSINQWLEEKYSYHPLSEFGRKSYRGNYVSIFCEYWRTFLVIGC